MDRKPLRSILVVGDSLAGWTAAATLARRLKRQDLAITVLAAAEIVDPSAVSTLPAAAAFHRMLDIDERELMSATQASFRLGTAFADWWNGPGSTFLPLGRHGSGIDYLAFQHYAIRKHLEGDRTPLEAYSLCARAAHHGTFAHPVSDPASPLYSLAYGLNLQADKYRDFMRRLAQGHGVTRVEDRLDQVRLAEDGEAVDALILRGGQALTADLYIDASGAGGRILPSLPGVSFRDWSDRLPHGHVISALATREAAPAPRTDCQALPFGWARQLPLQHANLVEVSSRSDAASIDAAREWIASEGLALIGERTRQVGRLDVFWKGNAIALGAAAGELDDLAASSLDLVHSALQRLLDLFPDRAFAPVLAEEYNRRTRQELDGLLDYHLALRLGATVPGPGISDDGLERLPDSLRTRLEVFESGGQLPQWAGEPVDENAWASLFLVQGRWPSDYNHCLDSLDPARLDERFRQTRELIEQAARRMPAHGEYLARYCPAPKA